MNGAMVEPTKEERKDHLNISFANPDTVYEVLGEFELDDEIEITVKGKITGFSVHESGDYRDGHFDMEVTSINGKTSKAKDNEDELEDMQETMMPGSTKKASKKED